MSATYDLKSQAFQESVEQWIVSTTFFNKYWEICGIVKRKDGLPGMVKFMLRRSSIKRFENGRERYQCDLIQIEVNEEDRKQNVFLKTAEILAALSSKFDRGLYLECANSKDIQLALKSKSHEGKWCRASLCPEDKSNNYFFAGTM